MTRDAVLKMDAEVVAFLVDHGRLPKWAEKADWAEAAENRLARKLQALWQAGADKVIAEVKRRGVPKIQMQQDALAGEAVDALTRQAPDVMVEEAAAVADSASRSVARQLTQAGMRVKFSGFKPAILKKLEDYVFQGSQATMERLKGDVGQVLRKAVEEGLGIDDAAKRLREVFDDLRRNRLTTIARTEIQSAQNQAANDTMRDLGAEYKQWLTAGPGIEGIRVSHLELHGMVMRMDEPFPNGLMYPGDRSGPIEEWINCRCRQRPYIPRAGEVITVTPYIP